jgi:hypothetical protein
MAAAALLQTLKGISPTRAAALGQALGVHTIAEIATSKLHHRRTDHRRSSARPLTRHS